ncbi:MAG: Rubrerythrin [Deltaproteobacteria bacterium]|nr:Rubrerythrin [Deltaproteobacteria bacterium]
MRKNTPVEEDISPVDAIRKALEREKAAYRGYMTYAEVASPPEIRELFLFLAEEEKKHAKLLADEIEKETLREM